MSVPEFVMTSVPGPHRCFGELLAADVAVPVAAEPPVFMPACVPEGAAGGDYCALDGLLRTNAVVIAAVAVTTVARPVMKPGMLVKNFTTRDCCFLPDS